MRLKSVFVSQYKNLKNFTLGFDGASFIDVFVGKNGSGKSNLFEALIEIFRHIYEYDEPKGSASNNLFGTTMLRRPRIKLAGYQSTGYGMLVELQALNMAHIIEQRERAIQQGSTDHEQDSPNH